MKKILYFKNIQTPRSLSRGNILFGKNMSYFLPESKLKAKINTKFGAINPENIQLGELKTDQDKLCYAVDASITDLFNNLKKGAQHISLKDAATILAETGINHDSIILDAGSGSGTISLFLSYHAKQVFSFDIDKKHLEICEKNKTFLNRKNITYYNADITDTNKVIELIKNIHADVFILDMLKPISALPTVKELLKISGYLVVYTTQLTQAKEVVNTLDKDPEFIVLNTKEVLHIEWDLHNKKAKPLYNDLQHTGFMVFARRIKR